VSRLILASNENDILARFFNNADYSVGDVVSTLSPSMDIQVASNFERYLYYRVGEDPERLRDLLEGFTHDGRLPADSVPHTDDDIFAAGRGDTRSTLDTIRRVYRDHGYLLDPHTAVGVSVGLQFADEKEPLICLATAHPAKFAEAIRRAVGADVAHHPAIDSLKDKPTRCDRLPASKGAVMDYIERITETA